MKPWPRLTETLPHPRAFERCQACGKIGDVEIPGLHIKLWQECDDQDHREPRFLWLCLLCSNAIIEPHPRLYHQLHRFAPAAGAMAICGTCPHQQNLRCTYSATDHGGEQLVIRAGAATCAFVDGVRGGRRTGWREVWYATAPADCSGKPFEL